MKFIVINDENYVTGLYSEEPADGKKFTEEELRLQEKRGFIQVSNEEAQMVNADWRYIEGKLMPLAEPEDNNDEESLPLQPAVAEMEYYVTVDGSGLVNGMYTDPGKGRIQLSKEDWESIGPGYSVKDGKPVPPPEPTQDEIDAETMRVNAYRQQVLLTEAAQSIIIWQTKLLMGRKLTDKESASLNLWMDYIDAVSAVDPQNKEEIIWPDQPA